MTKLGEHFHLDKKIQLRGEMRREMVREMKLNTKGSTKKHHLKPLAKAVPKEVDPENVPSEETLRQGKSQQKKEKDFQILETFGGSSNLHDLLMAYQSAYNGCIGKD
ncbi:unnamed protein product [Brachionus calyciflorus]|uniref:Uncharacterized protein n=1 Tax=Brachionus calyciflorus TaxID=104777 RepID=A0A814ML62_9BILA|nr:unnamed protein product [Brachionus calyciflorus]